MEVLQVLDPPLLPFGEVPILKALTNRIIQAIIVVTILTLAFPEVRRQFKGILADGIKSVSKTVQIQLCAGIMLGAFYASGMIEQVVALPKD